MNAIDEYIAGFPAATQKMLNQMRSTIKKAAPKAEEIISYKMPAYKLNGMLVYFAGYKNHIGFYAVPSGIAKFKKELSVYKGAKGSVQFPLTQPLPVELITKIVKFRVEENLMRQQAKIMAAGTQRTCSKGHTYIKSSDCPTCPICEKGKIPTEGFLVSLPAPARRALENKGIKTIKQLSKYTEAEILALHGMGKTSLPKLLLALKKEKLKFKK